ncbi:peptidase inhibitor 16 [Plakobranchus ocellatus]|uniref:Peptidase inhibitor 16 n=1 Tax=Plakobranchus ocellatus TaxID=259542 RepID=A0AAV3ZS84_9GAST|nr:peptidase inhibitor 16 [Plakobranchus ocellatus]
MGSFVHWLDPFLLITSYVVVMGTEDVVTYTDAGVMVERRATEGEHLRVRREISKNMTGFNHEEAMAMLQRHNELRSSRKASDMMYMIWDDRLAESAQKWAEKCIFEHSTNRANLAGFQHVGENLFAGTGKFDPAHVVQLWYNEVKYYSYKSKGCSHVCGHYTQVVWASSRALGCGVKYCPKFKSFRPGSGYHVACHYGPGGNYVGERPYALGDICSKCPKNALFCVSGLCAKRPKIGSIASQAEMSILLIVTALATCAFYASTTLK